MIKLILGINLKQMGMIEVQSNNASVIIVTYNHRKYMKNCLSSVLANNPLEVIVVGNNSADGTAKFVKESFPRISIMNF